MKLRTPHIACGDYLQGSIQLTGSIGSTDASPLVAAVRCNTSNSLDVSSRINRSPCSREVCTRCLMYTSGCSVQDEGCSAKAKPNDCVWPLPNVSDTEKLPRACSTSDIICNVFREKAICRTQNIHPRAEVWIPMMPQKHFLKSLGMTPDEIKRYGYTYSREKYALEH